MVKQRRGSQRQTSHHSTTAFRRDGDIDDPFEEWERYPATEAEENVEYQRVAWYGAPFGDAGVALLVLTALVNVLRRVAHAAIRVLMR